MNYKSILSSWFGLGILMFALGYPFQYIFTLIGMAQNQMQDLSLALAGMTAAMLFTYYFYPRIMSPLFKIGAILTSFCISMAIAAGVILSNSVLRSTFSEMIQNIFQGFDIRHSLLFFSMLIFALLINFGIWYLFITLGNKQMLKAIARQAKK